MIRALVVTTWFPDDDHPWRTPFCLRHVQALLAVGVDAQVLHIRLDSAEPLVAERFEGVPVTRVALNRYSPRSWWRVSGLLWRQLKQVDVVHTMAFSSIPVALFPWALRRRRWVHTEHWSGIARPASAGTTWRLLAPLRHLLRLPHVITAVSSQLAADLARFAKPQATRVVPCVVERLDEVRPFPPLGPLRLVGVGRLNEGKNPLLAVDVVDWLRRRGVDVYFEWIGDGPLMPAARARAAAAGLSERIAFSGAVPPEAVPSAVSRAHLFCVPTAHETFFAAAAEAIASGRMVVLPRTGAFVEYCTTENSVLADELSVEAMGQAIMAALELLPTRSPTSIAASLDDRFSATRIGRLFLDCYNEAGHGLPIEQA